MKFYTYTAEIENIKALNNSEENETEKVQFFGKSVIAKTSKSWSSFQRAVGWCKSVAKPFLNTFRKLRTKIHIWRVGYGGCTRYSDRLSRNHFLSVVDEAYTVRYR